MGAVGSACVRDCVRSTHECASEDLLSSSGDVPVAPSSSSTGGPNPSILSPRDGNANVPPVPNWFQVLQNGRGRDQTTETPRFDEVLQSPRVGTTDGQFMTPRSNAGGDFRTPGPSPRDSPRPPNEDPAGAKSTQISYEGTYLGTMKHGTGRLRMNACTYDGDFLNDFKHGNGTLNWDDGRQYRGQFEYGKFHGVAVMTWPDGRKYSGQYAEDRKHGDGTFSWQDGRRYKGQWVCGKRHGEGVYTNAKGITRNGTWHMDRPMQWDKAQSVEATAMPSVAEAEPPTPAQRERQARLALPWAAPPIAEVAIPLAAPSPPSEPEVAIPLAAPSPPSEPEVFATDAAVVLPPSPVEAAAELAGTMPVPIEAVAPGSEVTGPAETQAAAQPSEVPELSASPEESAAKQEAAAKQELQEILATASAAPIPAATAAIGPDEAAPEVKHSNL